MGVSSESVFRRSSDIRNAGAAGDGGEMNEPIGRAADGQQHAQRVLHRLRGDDPARAQSRADHRHRAAPALFGRPQPVGVDRRNRRGAGKRHAERLGDRGHGARRAHHRAAAGGGRKIALDVLDVPLRNFACPVFRPKTPAIGAGAQPFAVIAHRQHRPADELDGRQVGRGGAHQERRHGLVAGADQHHRVHRLRPDHFLHVHRHQVAKHHAGGVQKDFAERDRREVERQAADGQDAAFHRFDQLGKMPMTIIETARRLGDADDRSRQHFGRIPHGLRERTPQVERKIGVAVIGQSARQTALFSFLLVFARFSCFSCVKEVPFQLPRPPRLSA